MGKTAFPGGITVEGGLPVGAITLRLAEVIIAYNTPNIATGATLLTIPAGDRVLLISDFIASALTHTTGVLHIGIDGVYTLLSPYSLGAPGTKVGLFGNESIQATSAVVLTVRLESGTWTGGSVRFSILIATPTP